LLVSLFETTKIKLDDGKIYVNGSRRRAGRETTKKPRFCSTTLVGKLIRKKYSK